MKTNRIKEIEEYILSNESVPLDSLCDIFKISKNTIRRDINELVKKGNVKKVYGGVTAVIKPLIPFEERNIKNNYKKMAIAKVASDFVNDGDVIFIDSGTTTLNMIDFLKNKNDVTILTNNLNVIVNALPFPNLNVICTGGRLIRKTNSFEVIHALTILKDYNINKAFMATTGISISNGATNSSSFEYKLKKIIVEKSNKLFLLVDSSKFDISALMTYCQLREIDHIITDKKPSEKYIEFFEENKINFSVSE